MYNIILVLYQIHDFGGRNFAGRTDPVSEKLRTEGVAGGRARASQS